VTKLVSELGLGSLQFKKLDRQDRLVFPGGKAYTMPSGIEATRRMLLDSFPSESAG